MRAIALLLFVSFMPGLAFAAAVPRLGEIKDADTRAWWTITAQLSGDDMQGRDTGSPSYQRAADLVARQFQAAGLQPAGDKAGWFQTVPLHEVAVEKAGTTFTLERRSGARIQQLQFLHEIDVRATEGLPANLDGPLVFRGYCGKPALGDVKDKVVVCFDTRRAGMVSSAERVQATSDADALGVIMVDDPFFTIEPPRWPSAYARAVFFRGEHPASPRNFAIMRLSAVAFAKLIAGAGRDPQQILDDGGHQKALEGFDIPARLKAQFTVTQRDLESPNVLGVLPGSDPTLKAQYVVLSAHLDGYGHGEAVEGDNLYNGALDDAAYVALLIQTADRLKASTHAPRRSIIFCAFTGEEKGLLGATWFARHPTVPAAAMAADINLDQLRPLFPLNILTMHALDDTTLGDDVRAVAGPMAIEIRPDREPERNLIRRADNWAFMQIGVPATGFVFGYDPGTDAEKRYRQWYQVRYHRPQDDLGQPMDFEAAAKFNTFFYALVDRLANAATRPAWKAASPYRPK